MRIMEKENVTYKALKKPSEGLALLGLLGSVFLGGIPSILKGVRLSSFLRPRVLLVFGFLFAPLWLVQLLG